MAEQFIVGEHKDGTKFSAFVTSNKPACNDGGEHKWDGEEIMTFHNDKRIMKRNEFDLLPKVERDNLNQESGQCSCSKCGIGYMSYDNPFYSDF